jgi:CRISPR-associated protein Cst2
LFPALYGAAANNRGENEGNITTLQKLLWNGEVHTTVSAEAIRWALRYHWQKTLGESSINRKWNEEKGDHEWQDSMWKGWNPDATGGVIYADDDVLGFMEALSASQETDTLHAIPRRQRELREDEEEAEKNDDQEALGKAREKRVKFEEDLIKLKGSWNKLNALKKEQTEETKKVEKEIRAIRKRMDLKGVTLNRRGALEVTRALSLTPFAGDITFNAKSGEKSSTSLYGTEVHATRYQYGFALTPEWLREKSRLLDVVDAIISLSEVAGNHSRFLYDFSPDSVIFRWTDDFAPRLLYGFQLDAAGHLTVPEVMRRVDAEDINPQELFIGGSFADTIDGKKLKDKGACVLAGVKAAAAEVKKRIQATLQPQ